MYRQTVLISKNNKNKQDRLWRKNRAPTNNPLCSGIDLNRNYDANFGGDGSSDLACSETVILQS